MQVAVIADIAMQKEFENKGLPEGAEVHFALNIEVAAKEADVYFYLLKETQLLEDLPFLQKLTQPVFVNAVVTTLHRLPKNFIRVNAWPGFFQRSIIELSVHEEFKEVANEVLNDLKWQYIATPDIPGFITARTVAMIINEAYFALGDEVSTKADIDIAMKLGTNYPYGPFEWSEKIGLENVHSLLSTLLQKDERYIPAPALLKELK